MKREVYEQNPTSCKQCGNIIPYKKGVQVKVFCDLSCASKYNNIKRFNTTKVDNICNGCMKSFETNNRPRKFCSHLCSTKTKKNENINQWKSGKLQGYSGKAKQLKPWIRKYLFEVRGTACSECGWDKRHPVDDSVLTEIDHIDGNAENCHEDNLRILCPNCHSMTETHRARNKNGTRNTRYN